MIRVLFAIFVLFALLGDARIFLFVLNRFVFGSHRHEKSPWGWLVVAVPPLLAALTFLFRPLNVWVGWLLATQFMESVTPDALQPIALSRHLASIGAVWLIVAASVGLLWIVERAHALSRQELPLSGVRTFAPEVIRLRRAHLPAPLRALGAHNDLYDLEVTRHEVFIDDLPPSFDGYRIAFLTDTHVVRFVRPAYYQTISAQVQLFDPDIVVFGGDFVSWHRDIPLAAQVLTDGLSPRDGMYAILGNHDYWAGAESVREAFAARSVEFIVNRRVLLRRGGDLLPLAGIDEVYRGEPDPEAALGSIDVQTPVIAVSHHPDIIDLLDGRRIDLLLCGHTHGGQIRFPFFGSVVVPSRHEAEFAAGFHRVRGVLMYVSRGIGGIPPIRILCRPEVATFTLRRGERSGA